MAVQQEQTILKTVARVAFAFVATFALATMIESAFSYEGESSSQPDDVLQLSPDIDTDWRYTKDGWQQMGDQYRDSFAPLRTFESVHPFIWAAAVVMAVASVTIWAASEWEIARFSNRDHIQPDCDTTDQ